MRTVALLLAALGITGAILPAQAQVAALIARPNGADEINWGQVNVPPGATLSTPQQFASYGGIAGSITVDQRGGDAFIQQQCCCANRGIFDGNFAQSDLLVVTNTPTTMTLSFKKPVKTVGTQIASNQISTFTAQIQVYNKNQLLGTFIENGIVTSTGDNSAIFLGVTDTTADITSVVYSVTNGGSPQGFAINEVSVSQQ